MASRSELTEAERRNIEEVDQYLDELKRGQEEKARAMGFASVEDAEVAAKDDWTRRMEASARRIQGECKRLGKTFEGLFSEAAAQQFITPETFSLCACSGKYKICCGPSRIDCFS